MRTEHAYVGWIRRFILANGKRHPRDMGGAEVEAFLSGLAVQGNVSPNTQNQALSALLFLYREVLGLQLPWLDGVVRAKRPQRVPTVLSREEIACALAHMDGRPWLVASLLYGTGMRLMEALRLRVKDVDFDRCEITVRDGKGARDRHTMLPRKLVEPLRREIERAAQLHAHTISPMALAQCGCLMRWRGSPPGRRASRVGSTCSLRRNGRAIRGTAPNGAIISTMPSSVVR